jgi:hypothetical protein
MKDLWEIEKPGARLIAALDSDVLLRGSWAEQRDGREMACALAWMSREALHAEDASACPASLMPQWAADVIPWLDDAPSAEAWPSLMRRLGVLIDRATPAVWSPRLQTTWCRIAVTEAMQHTTKSAAVAACKRVIALLDDVIAGKKPRMDRWRTAQRAAATAESAAAWEAAAAAGTAWWAAAEAAGAAWWAAEAEARVAAVAASVAAAEAAGAEAEAAARMAAADRMASAMLDALEQEIEANTDEALT